MAVALRAHHLLCILTYSGQGYSAAFVHGFNAIVEQLGAGVAIELVRGPDAVCEPLRSDACAHCHGASVQERDRLAAQDLAPWWGQALAPGVRLQLNARLLQQLRQAFAQGVIRSACVGCPWEGLCAEIAHRRFEGALLHMGATPAQAAADAGLP